MDLTEYEKRVDKLETKIDNINQNVILLTTVLEGILEQFETIQKEIKK